MDRHELIAQARELDGDIPSTRKGPGRMDGISEGDIELVGALEVIHGHGFADEVGGHSDATTGYFYRVERWVVQSDERGFLGFIEFSTTDAARVRIEALDAQYAREGGGSDG